MPASIQLTVKGLAKFMSGNATQQRKALKDYKFPDPEGKAQRDYYRDVRNAVVTFLRTKKPIAWLHNRADNLALEARSADEKRAARLKNNSRAIRQYAANFAPISFVYEGKHPSLYVTFGRVRISCSPDLIIKYRGRTKIVKLEFGKDVMDDANAKIMTQAMFEALNASGSAASSTDVWVLEVASGKTLKGARVGSRRRTEIKDACKNIESLWPTI